MEDTKFKFGPVQTAWLKSLREHPERQTSGCLGFKFADKTGVIAENYKACCLGEGGIIAGVCEWDNNHELCAVTDNDSKPDKLWNKTYLKFGTFKALGLYDHKGRHKDDTNDYITERSLATYNDQGMTWPEIADIIEANPTDYFKESK